MARMGLGPCPEEVVSDGDGAVAGSGPWVCLTCSLNLPFSLPLPGPSSQLLDGAPLFYGVQIRNSLCEAFPGPTLLGMIPVLCCVTPELYRVRLPCDISPGV